MRDARSLIKSPIISEKSYELAEQGKYVFRVDKSANKTEIGKAIEEIFGVKVTGVNTQRRQGKVRRQGMHSGRRPGWKKAIVTLKEGDKIEIFETK